MKNIILAIFIALSNLAYSQIELNVPSNGEKFTLEKEEAKKYNISLHTLDSSKKYTIVAKDIHSDLGKEYTTTNVADFVITDSLELTKDKAIEISVIVKDANDVILNNSEWTIFLKKKDNSYKEQVKAIMDSINTEENKSRIVGHLRYLKNDKDELDVVVKDKKNNREYENEKFKLDSIELKIKRGSIKDIRVFGKLNDDNEQAVFGKENRNIDIFKINDESQRGFSNLKSNRYLELLYPKKDKSKNYYIKLSQLLAYDYVMGKKFFPKDAIIKVKMDTIKVNERISLYKDVHLNSYLEGRIYTDIIGLNGEEPNGVAQAEIKAHFNLNTQSVFAFVEPSLHYSKFTKDNDFVVLDSVQSKALTDFHRQAFLSVGLKLNIKRWEFGDRYDIPINIGSQYSWTRLKEITSTIDITNTVHLFNSFIEIKGKMNEFHNFGLSVGNKFLYELPVQDQNLDLNPFSWYIIPEVEIFYYPVENKNNTIYLRFTYTSNTRNHDYDYPSLQFGYKFRIKLNQK